MVSTPQIQTTQAGVLGATSTGGTVRSSQAGVLAAIQFPTAGARVSQASINAPVFSNTYIKTSQAYVRAPVFSNTYIKTSQAGVLVAVAGRVQNPRIRAWTFTLDGHDFYVLRLGSDATLVYDVYSEQWMDWDAFAENYWPVNIGFNWIGAVGLMNAAGADYGSNILVGDDSSGQLYFLDPEQPYDESPYGPNDPQQEYYFPRVVQGQVPMKGREVLPCFSAWLTTDMGAPAYTGAGVKLEISDDAGATYQDMGTVELTAGENRPELAWYSLGQIEAPGRLFRITDDGAVTRLDSLEMNDPDDGP